EIDQHLQRVACFAALGLQCRDLLRRLFDLEVAAVEDLVCPFERGNGFGRVAAPAEPFAVDADRPEGVARADDIGRDVLPYGTGAAYHAMRADAHELVHGRRTAQYGPVVDMDMAGQLHAVGNDRVAGYLAIVRNVHVGHDPVVVAHAGYTHVLRRARIDGDVLAHHVAVADLESGGLALVLL